MTEVFTTENNQLAIQIKARGAYTFCKLLVKKIKTSSVLKILNSRDCRAGSGCAGADHYLHALYCTAGNET